MKEFKFYKWLRDVELEDSIPNITGICYFTKREAIKDRNRFKNMYKDPKCNNFKLRKIVVIIEETN